MIDWFDLLANPRDSQHDSLKTSVLQGLAFFMVQLSHLHLTTGKTISLTMRTFVSKVMSLLFNTLLLPCTPTPSCGLRTEVAESWWEATGGKS